MEALEPIQLLNANICDGQSAYRRISWDGSGSSEFEYDEDGQIVGCPRWECPAQITQLWNQCEQAIANTIGKGKNRKTPAVLIDGQIFNVLGRGRHNPRKQSNGYVLQNLTLGIQALIICDPYRDDPEALTLKFTAIHCAQTTQEERGNTAILISAMLGLTNATPPTPALTTPEKVKDWCQDKPWRQRELQAWQISHVDIANDVEITRHMRHEDYNAPGYGIGSALISKAATTLQATPEPTKLTAAGPAINMTSGKKGQSLITSNMYDKIMELRTAAAENPDIAKAKIRIYNIPEKYHAFILGHTNEMPETTVLRFENTAIREWLSGMGWRTLGDIETHWPELLSSINTRRLTQPNLSDSKRSRWPTHPIYRPIEESLAALPPAQTLKEPIQWEDALATRILEGHLRSQVNIERIGLDPSMTKQETVDALGRAYNQFPTIKPTPETNDRKRRHLDKLEAILAETQDTTEKTPGQILQESMANVLSGCGILKRTPENRIAEALRSSGYSYLKWYG